MPETYQFCGTGVGARAKVCGIIQGSCDQTDGSCPMKLGTLLQNVLSKFFQSLKKILERGTKCRKLIGAKFAGAFKERVTKPLGVDH